MDCDDDALLKSQHINTMGQFWTTKAFLPRMLELQHGHITAPPRPPPWPSWRALTLGLLDCPKLDCPRGGLHHTVLPFHTNTEMFQGMRVRFPALFPPLKPETVAERTVDAVRTNTTYVYMPWTMHALVVLKSFMPQAALEEIHKFSGTYSCMNTFKGRT
ncbi:hypothetical protein J4Q44_G00103190 [Coregonus suidteri]|uniref:Uncharacterized protein n=1 Tax=Coregonus suidteri TaxID=861788 RepID=A0AAN8LUV8_9TELE